MFDTCLAGVRCAGISCWIEVFKSGAESATLVKEDDYWWVSYNGHPSIEVQSDGEVNVAETISGVIPALSAPRLEKALVLGLGTGITAGATASIFESTDVVEINNAFYDMMPQLAHANLNIGTNPAADLYLADGRSFLVGKEGLYDAIVNSIPAPTYYSASKIYTIEFYERVSEALKPDGVFCAWLSSWNMSEKGLQAILSAIHRSFEYCDLRLMTRGYYMTTCANQPVEPRGRRGRHEDPVVPGASDGGRRRIGDHRHSEREPLRRRQLRVLGHYRPAWRRLHLHGHQLRPELPADPRVDQASGQPRLRGRLVFAEQGRRRRHAGRLLSPGRR